MVCALCLLGSRSSESGDLDSVSRPVFVVTGFTAPSRQASVGATHALPIVSIPVEPGARVRAGDLLAALDDTESALQTVLSKGEAQSDLRVRLALSKWRRIQQSTDPGHDRDLADTEAEIARLEYELAVFEQSQNAWRWQQAQHLLDDCRIVAPFDGYVRDHHHHVGEIAPIGEPIITLIRIDPLRVTVPAPITVAPYMMTGDRYEVTPVDQNWSTRVGTITRVHRTVDPKTQTFLVELIVENSDELWRPGLKVSLDLYAPLPDTRDRHTRRDDDS